jgi:hypothetical protein
MLTVRQRRTVAILLIVFGLLLGAAPAAIELHAIGWDNWTVAPPFNPDD